MRGSTERILTTHVGSLPRSQAVTDVLFSRERGEIKDRSAAATVISNAVADVVRRQREAGVDIVSDGESNKISYATYIADRFAGFGGDTPREPGQDLVEFPRFMAKLAASGATAKYRRPRCVGEIRLKDAEPLNDDLRNLRRAVDAAKPVEAFMNAASPGVLALFQPNDFYKSQDAYLEALGAAMQTEYEAIVGAGFLLQIDAPGSRHGPPHDVPECECRGLPESGGAAHRSAQSRPAEPASRQDADAHLLGKLRRARITTTCRLRICCPS